jgi:hypothetical protein
VRRVNHCLARHHRFASYTTHTSNSISTSSASGQRSGTRFLGLRKDQERVREPQQIREVERRRGLDAVRVAADLTDVGLCAKQRR